MSCQNEYAIVDVGNGRASEGKILVLLDDELTAQDMATELRRRGCRVTVKEMATPCQASEPNWAGLVAGPAASGNDRLTVPASR
jgi:hypothetical protein